MKRLDFGDLAAVLDVFGVIAKENDAMESAIRRVINLRMKGNGIFWIEENAETMIMLRSFYNAGR